nr:hypothetical protein CFP56_04487 [Quercus suber]
MRKPEVDRRTGETYPLLAETFGSAIQLSNMSPRQTGGSSDSVRRGEAICHTLVSCQGDILPNGSKAKKEVVIRQTCSHDRRQNSGDIHVFIKSAASRSEMLYREADPIGLLQLSQRPNFQPGIFPASGLFLHYESGRRPGGARSEDRRYQRRAQ